MTLMLPAIAERPAFGQSTEAPGVALNLCPAVELMSLVHLLAGSRFATDLETPWVTRAREHFAPWADHAAIRRAGEVLRSGVTVDDLARALWRADMQSESQLAGYSWQDDTDSNSDSILRSFVADLGDFASSSSYQEFLNENRVARLRMLGEERVALAPGLERIGKYLGQAPRATICLNPFFTTGSLSWQDEAHNAMSDRSPRPDAPSLTVVVLGPTATGADMPGFGRGDRLDSDLLTTLVRPTVQAIVEASRDSLAGYAELFEPVAYRLAEQRLSTWTDAWQEHVVQAIVTRLLSTSGREGEAGAELERLVQAGFLYIDPLLDQLRLYEKGRDQYPTLVSFYPALLGVLDREIRIARSVGIDPRIELMTGIQMLDGSWLLSRYDSPYRKDLWTFLRDAARDPAVETYRQLASQGFAFDVVPRFFALLTPADLSLSAPVPGELARRAGGKEKLRILASQLPSFVNSIDFNTFLKTHKGTFAAIELKNRRAAADAADILWAYLGETPSSWRITLGLLLHNGGFATGEEALIPQAFIGPVGVSDGLPDFGGLERIGPLIWHEFSHTVVNPLAEVHEERVAELEFGFEPIQGDMAEQAYGDWKTTLNEHVVRAIEVCVTERVLGTAAAVALIDSYEGLGFQYLSALVEELREYESDREQYPTLKDFYPRLLDRLEQAASRQVETASSPRRPLQQASANALCMDDSHG
jgi:hypothetical protein